MKYPFIDLAAQQARIRPGVDAALARVLDHGQYILGPEVAEFEQVLGDYEGGAHVQGCANGTDAIILPLLAWGIGRGDAVFCPSFTYAATAEAIAITKATPVFVDVRRDTYTLCPDSFEAAIEGVMAAGELTPKAVIAVDLFGQPADYPALKPIADKYGLKLLADSAQAMGCRLNGRAPIDWADVVTTSFFPAKPLGCYGDGGAMLTRDEALFKRLNSLHFHGRGHEPYDHASIGMNSRLDSFQAAVLLEKMKIFDDEIKARNKVARRYTDGLGNRGIVTPAVIDGGLSTWAQYTVEVDDRDGVMTRIKEKQVPVAAYYPRPTHLQTAYQAFPRSAGGLAATEAAMERVMALPIHPYLSEADQDDIIEVVLESLG